MAHLVTFDNTDIPHPENGDDNNREWNGYDNDLDNVLYEIIYLLQNS